MMALIDTGRAPSMAAYGHSLHYCPDPECPGDHVGGLPMGYSRSYWRTRHDPPGRILRKNLGYPRCPEHGVIVGPAGACKACAI